MHTLPPFNGPLAKHTEYQRFTREPSTLIAHDIAVHVERVRRSSAGRPSQDRAYVIAGQGEDHNEARRPPRALGTWRRTIMDLWLKIDGGLEEKHARGCLI